jgi:hypothetical protein
MHLQIAFKPLFARTAAFAAASTAIDAVFWLDICIQLNTAILGRFGTEIFSRRCVSHDAPLRCATGTGMRRHPGYW